MLEGQEGVTWPEWMAAAQTAERLGFEAIYTSDHYFSVMGNRERGSSDAWTNLAALAAVTSDDPAGHDGLARDVPVAGGAREVRRHRRPDQRRARRRSAWAPAGGKRNTARHGFPFPPTNERFEMLTEQLEIVHRLLTEDEVTFRGTALPPRRGAVRAQRGAAAASRRSSWAATGGPRIAALVSPMGRRVRHRRRGAGTKRASASRAFASASTPTDGRRTR